MIRPKLTRVGRISPGYSRKLDPKTGRRRNPRHVQGRAPPPKNTNETSSNFKRR